MRNIYQIACSFRMYLMVLFSFVVLTGSIRAQCPDPLPVPMITNTGVGGGLCTFGGSFAVDVSVTSTVPILRFEFYLNGNLVGQDLNPVFQNGTYQGTINNNLGGAGNVVVKAIYASSCGEQSSSSVQMVVHSLTLGSINALLCPDDLSVDIGVNISGGTGPYSVSYQRAEGGSGTPSQVPGNQFLVTVTEPGGYTFNVTDANGCSISANAMAGSFTVSLAPPTATNVSCLNDRDAVVCTAIKKSGDCDVDVFVRWTGGTISGHVDDLCASGLGRGIYTGVLYDVSTQQPYEPSSVVTAVVSEPVHPTPYITQMNPGPCEVNGTGQFIVFVVPGNFKDYTYNLIDDEDVLVESISPAVSSNNVPVFNEVAPGVYTLCVVPNANPDCQTCVSRTIQPNECTKPPMPTAFSGSGTTTSSEINIQWNHAHADVLPFQIRYRKKGVSSWTYTGDLQGQGVKTITDLDPCFDYEVQIGVRCCLASENPVYLDDSDAKNIKVITTNLGLEWPVVENPIDVCVGNSLTMNVNKILSGVTLEWYEGATLLETDAAGNPPAEGWGTYETGVLQTSTLFKLRSIAGDCERDIEITVNVVNPNPGTLVGMSISDDKLCPSLNESFTLNLQGATGNIIQWESSIDNFVNVVTTIAHTASSYVVKNIHKTTRFRVLVQTPGCSPTYSTIGVVFVNDLALELVSVTHPTTENECKDGVIQVKAIGGVPQFNPGDPLSFPPQPAFTGYIFSRNNFAGINLFETSPKTYATLSGGVYTLSVRDDKGCEAHIDTRLDCVSEGDGDCAPLKPTLLTFIKIGQAKIDDKPQHTLNLTWNPETPDANTLIDKYIIEWRRKTGENTWSIWYPIASNYNGDARSGIILIPIENCDEPLEARIISVCFDGTKSKPSDTLSIIGNCQPGGDPGCNCPTPVLTLSNITDEEFTVNWNAVPGATKYYVYTGLPFGDFEELTTTSYTFEDLSACEEKPIKVEAICSETCKSAVAETTCVMLPSLENLTLAGSVAYNSSTASYDAAVSWSAVSEQTYDLRWKYTDETDYSDPIEGVTSVHTLQEIERCRPIETQLKAFCPAGISSSDWSSVLEFSGGSLSPCTAPTNVRLFAEPVSGARGSILFVRWDAVPGAQNYTVEYRPYGEGEPWISKPSNGTSPSLLLETNDCRRYRVRVKAHCCGGGESAFSTEYEVPSCLMFCPNLSVVAEGLTAARLTWNPQSFVCYKLSAKNLTTGISGMLSTNVPGVGTYLFANLSPDTDYEFRVEPLRHCGSNVLSRSCGPVVMRTNCPPASNLQVLVSGSDARATWSYPGNSQTKEFRVRYRMLLPEGPSDWFGEQKVWGAQYNLPSLLAGLTYEVEVCPTGNTDGVCSCITKEFTTPAACPEVTHSAFNSRVEMSWGGTPGTCYLVEYRPTASSSWVRIPLAANQTEYVADNLAPNTTYEFRVSPRSSCFTTTGIQGCSSFFRTMGCDRVSALTSFVNSTGTAASLNWSYSGATQVTPFRVQSRVVGSPSWATSTVMLGTSYELTGLLPNKMYEVQVCYNGNNQAWDCSCATTYINTTQTQPCPNVQASVDGTNVTLTWNVQPGICYIAKYRRVGSLQWLTSPVPVNTGQITIYSLQLGANYEFQVTPLPTCSVSSTSRVCGSVYAKTNCNPVSNLTKLYNPTNNSLLLSWSSPLRDNYTIKLRKQGNPTWYQDFYVYNKTQETIFLDQYNVTYNIEVCNGLSEGELCGCQTTQFTAPSLVACPEIVLQVRATDMDVFWNTISGALGYVVSWRQVGNTQWLTSTLQSSSTVKYTISGLKPFTKYEVKVGPTTGNTSQANNLCAAKTITTSSSETYCNGNPNVVVTERTVSAVYFDWTPVPNATNYMVTIKRVLSSTITDYKNVPASTINQLMSSSFANLSPNVRYEIIVTSYNGVDVCGTGTTIFKSLTGSECDLNGWMYSINTHSYCNQLRIWAFYHIDNPAPTHNFSEFEFKLRKVCPNNTTTWTTYKIPYNPSNPMTHSIFVDLVPGCYETMYRYNCGYTKGDWILTPCNFTIPECEQEQVQGGGNNEQFLFQGEVLENSSEVLLSGSELGGFTQLPGGGTTSLLGAVTECAVPDSVWFDSYNGYVRINWNSLPDSATFQILWRDSSLYSSMEDTVLEYYNSIYVPEGDTFAVIPAMDPCKTYAALIVTSCGDTLDQSLFGEFYFKPEYTCTAPSYLQAYNPTTNSTHLIWEDTRSSSSYVVQYREMGTVLWTTVATDSAGTLLTGLSDSTLYEVKVASICCGTDTTAFVTDTFQTPAHDCVALPTVQVVGGTTESSTISWNNLSGVAGYRVAWYASGDTSSPYYAYVAAPDTQLVFPGLDPCMNHRVEVSAVCSTGYTSNWTSTSWFNTYSCTAPTGVQVISQNNGNITVEWANSAAATSYIVRYRKTGTPLWTTAVIDSASLILSGLDSGSPYQVQVATICCGNDTTAYVAKNFLTPSTSCPALVGIQVVSSPDSSVFSWSALSGALGYHMAWYDSDTTSARFSYIAAPDTQLVLSGLDPCKTHRIEVAAACSLGVLSNWASSSPVSLYSCSAPEYVQAYNPLNNSAEIGWNSTGAGSSFLIRYRQVGTLPWSTKQESSLNTSLTGLSDSTWYEVEVATICCGNDTTAYVADTFLTASSACAALANVYINGGQDSARVYWPAVQGAIGYQVAWYAEGDTVSPYYGYVAAPDTQLILSALDPCQIYRAEVSVICAGNQHSSWVSSVPTSIFSCPTPQLPLVVNVVDSSATLIRSEAAPSELNWRIFYRKIGTGGWSIGVATTDTFELTGLLPDSYYEFRLQSFCCDSSLSAVSGMDTLKTLPTLCDAPSIESLTLIADSGRVSWSPVPSVLGYRVAWWSIDVQDTTYFSVEIGAPDTSLALQGLNPCLSYEIQVTSLCSDTLLESEASLSQQVSPGLCQSPSWYEVLNRSDNGVRLRWESINPSIGYTVNYKSVLDTSWTTQSVVDSETEITGLDANTEYAYFISSHCCAGDTSLTILADTFVTRTGTCSTPVLASMTQVFEGILLQWNEVPEIQQYHVIWYPDTLTSQSQLIRVTAPDTSILVTGTTRCDSITFSLVSICSNGTQEVWADTTLLYDWCPQPAYLTAQFVDHNSARITWDNTYADHYELRYRKVGDTLWTEIDSLTSFSHTLTGLQSDSTYEAQVSGYCCSGVSAGFTSSVEFRTRPYPCDAPEIRSVEATATSVRIEWKPSRYWASDYIVRWYIDTAQSAVTQRTIFYPDTSTTIHDLNPCYDYTVEVLTMCMLNLDMSPVVVEVHLDRCSAPSKPVVESVTDSSAWVRWNVLPGAQSYEVSWHLVWDSTWQSVTTSADSLFLSNLLVDTSYQVRVRAFCCGTDTSDWSILTEFSTDTSSSARLSNPIGEIGQEEAALTIYPNPSTGTFTLNYLSLIDEKAEVRVFDGLGREVYYNKVSLQKGSNFIGTSLGKPAAGIYILRFSTESGTTKSHKLIIE